MTTQASASRDATAAAAIYMDTVQSDPADEHARGMLRETGQRVLDDHLAALSTAHARGDWNVALEAHRAAVEHCERLKGVGVALVIPTLHDAHARQARDTLRAGLYADVARAEAVGDVAAARAAMRRLQVLEFPDRGRAP